jgi:hypothetical protein
VVKEEITTSEKERKIILRKLIFGNSRSKNGE